MFFRKFFYRKVRGKLVLWTPRCEVSTSLYTECSCRREIVRVSNTNPLILIHICVIDPLKVHSLEFFKSSVLHRDRVLVKLTSRKLLWKKSRQDIGLRKIRWKTRFWGPFLCQRPRGTRKSSILISHEPQIRQFGCLITDPFCHSFTKLGGSLPPDDLVVSNTSKTRNWTF